MKTKFYNPAYIVNNPRPFNFVLGNRNAGKSFGWKEFLIKNFLENKDSRNDCKFMLMFRTVDAVKMTARFFFDDVLDIKYPHLKLNYVGITNGFGQFFINDELAGFALCIKNYIQIKPIATVQQVEWALMDEFLCEDGKYLKSEMDIVRNIYSTCARGNGQFVRENFHMVFLSNTVSVSNPYFKAFPQIKESLKFNTKRIIRDSFQLHIILNDAAIKEIEKSDFGKAISGSKYAAYAFNNEFFNDNYRFVEKVAGPKDNIFTFIFQGKKFGVYRCLGSKYYISESYDKNRQVFSLENDDHDVNLIMLSRHESVMQILKIAYSADRLRFETLDCKLAFLVLTGLMD